MRANGTKQKLAEGKPVFGSIAYLSDPAVVEIIGNVGFDFVIIDTEHTSIDTNMVEQMVRAADVTGITPLVRVYTNEEKVILRALETGAQGIVVPFVRSGSDARQAYAATRYPPLGVRGMCSFSRAAQYGAVRADYKTYEEACNRDLLLVGLIEDRDGVANVNEILGAGIDVALVGRGDLSVSLGFPNEAEHPSVIAAADSVMEAANATGRWGGIITHNPGDAEHWARKDCAFICYSLDIWMLMHAYQEALEALKSQTEPIPVGSPG